MSRCFPFPPPGYEKKARIEDLDLIKKEKRKEKKQKKDKKDKEKREGSKEKKNKNKERKEKHGDKKDRKEKHKDKKDRGGDKDKGRTSNANRIEGQPECRNGDKLGSNTLQNNGIGDSLYVQDLAKRIRDDDRASRSQSGQNIFVTDPRGLRGRMVECSIDDRLEEKKKATERKEDDKKVNGQKIHSEVRSFGNATVPGFLIVDQSRFKGFAKSMEKNDVGKKMEEKEKNKVKDSYGRDGKDKDTDREKKSGSNEENRDKEKKKDEKTKEISETNKDQIKLKDSSPKLKDSSPKLKDSSPKLKDSSLKLKDSSLKSKDNCLKLKDGNPKLKEFNKGSQNSCDTKILDVLKTSGINPASEGNLCKRKEFEINGTPHENGIRPNKLPRLVSSSHQVMENGRKLEPSQTAGQLESRWQGEVRNCKGDMKELKINGLEVPKQAIYSSRPSPAKASLRENGEASVKPPHPDSKYLSQILSIPKLEKISDLGNQEWLFSSDCGQSKKPKVGSSIVDGTQVWAEALRIDSADLTALPYVTPF